MGPYGSYITMAASTPYGVVLAQTDNAGYSLTTFCYACSTYQQDTVLVYKIRQAIDCARGLNGDSVTVDDQTKANGDKDIGYDSSSTWKDTSYTTTSLMISGNTNIADCGAVTCEARESTCSTAATNVQIAAGVLQMKQDVVAGYNEVVCIRCVNTPMNTQTAGVMTKQVTFTQKRDCLTALTLVAVTNKVFPYEATGSFPYSITDG